MFTEAIHGEIWMEQWNSGGVVFELLRVPASLWCGSAGYAPNCADEPDIGALLQKYQSLCDSPKRGRPLPEWSCCISIDYWREGAVPRGMAFAQQVTSDQQAPGHDVYAMPESLFIRAAATQEHSRAALGKEHCEPFELFEVIKAAMKERDYAIADNGAQEIEMYNHEAGLAYAYVPVK